MNVAVIGMGYVGTTMSVALSLQGHQVIGLDVDTSKVGQLNQGRLPFYEEGMEEQLIPLIDSGKLVFHHDLSHIQCCDVLMITVGTPSTADGSADITFVESVAQEIGRKLTSYQLIVVKSTVPVGTGDRVKEIIQNELSQRGVKTRFDVVSNPEFLREGRALFDAIHPERVVIGCSSEQARTRLKELYRSVVDKLIFTSIRDAEMIKYASNAFLATKISFINELARLAEHTGTDITQIAKGMGMDSRIGDKFLHAGIGYGGSCFPKDIEALLSLASESGVGLSLLQAVTKVNQTQIEWFLEKVMSTLGGVKKKRIAVLGLTFKPNTDDIRMAPVLRILEFLLQRGATVMAYDPKGMEKMKQLYPQVDYFQSSLAALEGADAIILATEWPEIVTMDWQQVKQVLKKPILFDGRNALDPTQMSRIGYQYMGVGVISP
jgi:UDPglucose 6-dehydrogenase